MKQRLFYVIVVLFGIGITNAVKAQIMIDNGKIWEYVTEDIRYPENHYISYKFDKYAFGDEVEKYGRIYREWVQIRSDKYFRNDYLEEDRWQHIYEDMHSVQALLREEDGKVYMLLDREEVSVYEDNYSLDGYFPEFGKTVLREVECGEEVILYDFSCPVNSYFQGIWGDSVISPAVVTDYDKITNLDQQYHTMKMTFLWDYVKYFYRFYNKDKTEKEWLDDFLYTSEFTVVEGIGILKDGTLTDFTGPELIMSPDGYIMHKYLNNVYTKDGELIFEGENLQSSLAGIRESEADSPQSGKLFDLFGLPVVSPIPGSIYILEGRKILY